MSRPVLVTPQLQPQYIEVLRVGTPRQVRAAEAAEARKLNAIMACVLSSQLCASTRRQSGGLAEIRIRLAAGACGGRLTVARWGMARPQGSQGAGGELLRRDARARAPPRQEALPSHRAAAADDWAGDRLRGERPAQLTNAPRSTDKNAPPVGQVIGDLTPNEELDELETRYEEGLVRIRCARGWTSVSTLEALATGGVGGGFKQRGTVVNVRTRECDRAAAAGI
jgi:hypothetical protein